MLYPLLMRPSEPNLDCSGRAATYKGLDYSTDWVGEPSECFSNDAALCDYCLLFAFLAPLLRPPSFTSDRYRSVSM